MSRRKKHFSSVPEGQEGGEDNVGVPGVGAVGGGGPQPSPSSPA